MKIQPSWNLGPSVASEDSAMMKMMATMIRKMVSMEMVEMMAGRSLLGYRECVVRQQPWTPRVRKLAKRPAKY
jgi:hypothetical protein